jgi:hypothetical protein
MTKSQKQAKEFMNLVAEYGWELSDVRGSVVEIVKWITPNDEVLSESEALRVLGRPNSWRTRHSGCQAFSALAELVAEDS